MTLREFDALADRYRADRREAQYVQDMHWASLLCMTANLNRNPKKQPQPFKLEEFLLFGDAPTTAAPAPAAEKPKQTVEDMKRFAEAMTTGLGGKRIHRPKKEARPDGR